MGRGRFHAWVVQVPGNGYIEERTLYFDANGVRVEAQLRVMWNDGTRSTQVLTFLPDGELKSVGELSYPDDTQVSMRFHEDGTWEIVHRHPGSDDVTTWRYSSDGSALVREVRPCHDMDSHGGVMKLWNVRPDGSPAGDLQMWEELNETAGGQRCTIHTKETRDGMWTVTRKVWDTSGSIAREEDATHRPPPAPAPAPPTSTVPSTPTPAGDTDVSPFAITGISRLPEPSLAAGAGWVGPVPPSVDHIVDHWHEYPPGVITYLGSEVAVTES